MDGSVYASAEVPEVSGRPERLPVLAFVADAASEAVLREALVQILPGEMEVRRGNVRVALAALRQMPTPRALVIDVSGEAQPLALLSDLRHVVEPDVRVMVIGDREDMTFYRQATRSLGVVEYLYKPLSIDMVAMHFGHHIAGTRVASESGGRMICLCGARGGSGVSTLAANLAWMLAEAGRRHTVLLDGDLQTGTSALLLGSRTGPGLRSAIEAPERMDELFVERSAIPVSERLHLLATEDQLGAAIAWRPGAAERLMELLRRRFNYIVADVPFRGGAATQALDAEANARVLVMLPTLASVRDTLRILAVSGGPLQARRPLLVLNRAGMPGGLARAEIEQTLGARVQLCVPHLPELLGVAEGLGEPAARRHGAFRAAVGELARLVGAMHGEKPARGRWWKR